MLVLRELQSFIIDIEFRAKEPTFTQWLKIRVRLGHVTFIDFRPCLTDGTRMQWLVSAGFGCSVIGDLVLACILSLALHFSRTGLKR